MIVCSFVIVVSLEGLREKNESNSMTPSKLVTAINSEDDILVYFYQTDCVYCKQAKPIIDSLVDEMEIELENFNLQEYTAEWENFNITGTPTLVHYKDGAEVSRIDGLREEKEYREWFKDQAF